MLQQAQAGNFLAKAFRKGFQETKALPNDRPAEFQFFVNSLYGVWTESTESPFKCEGLKVSQKLKLYALAHKYACHDFQNAIISSVYESEHHYSWLDVICSHDLKRLAADVPDGSPMHRLLEDWLVKDMFSMMPGVNHIADEFLEGLPEFLVRAALKHLLTYSFPRSLNKKMPPKMKAEGKYLLPEDNQVQEKKRKTPVNDQGLSAGGADDTASPPRPPAGSWRHSSVPLAAEYITHGQTYSLLSNEIEGLDGEAADDIAMRSLKRRRFERGFSV